MSLLITQQVGEVGCEFSLISKVWSVKCKILVVDVVIFLCYIM